MSSTDLAVIPERTAFDVQTERLAFVMQLSGVAMVVSQALGRGNKAPPVGVLLQAIDDAIAESRKPKPTVRVYAKQIGEPVHAYDTTGTLEEAIAQVRGEGYPRAMVLVS